MTAESSNFQQRCMEEFFAVYRDWARTLYLLRLRALEYDLYVGIYGEEPLEGKA